MACDTCQVRAASYAARASCSHRVTEAPYCFYGTTSQDGQRDNKVKMVFMMLICLALILVRESAATSEAHHFRTIVNFGVVMPTFERQWDPLFRIMQLTALPSLMRQNLPPGVDWTLILVGDGLSALAVGRLHDALDRSGIPRHKIIFANLDDGAASHAQGDLPVEALPYAEGIEHGKWAFMLGVAPLNRGLDIAADMTSITHIARLDDDDEWLPHHLSNLARVYINIGDAGFVYASSLGFENIGSSPLPIMHPDVGDAFVGISIPSPCGLAHSAASWSNMGLVGQLRYRDALEQNVGRQRWLKSCCDVSPCSKFLPYDADFWERVSEICDKSPHALSYLITTPGVVYTDKRAKLILRHYIHGLARDKNTNKQGDTTGQNISADSILNHNDFEHYLLDNLPELSNTSLDGCAAHSLTHILRPLLALTRGQVYAQVGALCHAYLELAVSYPGLHHAFVVSSAASNPLHFIDKKNDGGSIKIVNFEDGKSSRDLPFTLASTLEEIAALGGIDVLVISGIRSVKEVVSDFLVFSQALRPGGVVVFDSYGDQTLSSALDKLVEVHRGRFVPILGLGPQGDGSTNSFGPQSCLEQQDYESILVLQRSFLAEVPHD